MTQLVYDIYGPTYPVITTRLERLTNQHYAAGTTFLAGRPMGSGSITVEKGQSFVTATNFAVGNYIIVRDLDLHPSNDTANVLGGFYLEEGDFLLVSDDPKTLTFKGRSTISVLERAIMGPESLSPFEGPHSIEAGYWRWGSDTYGGVMRRALFEANYQDPPGLPMISTLTVGVDNIWWDDNNDSNGNPWPNFAGEFRTQCGTTLFDLYRQMYGYGVELEIDARTFDVYAYNADGYGTDRTSGTFATGKVRLVAGVNIAADLTRQIHGRLPRTHLLVRTTDYPEGAWIASDDYTPGDPVFKGVYQSGDISGDPATSAALQSRAQRNMDLRQLAEDGIRIPMIEPGFVPLSGRYTPGPNFAVGPTVTTGHVWYADRITLHTGSHTMDYANASVKVEAIEYVLREAGDWQPIIHIGPRGFLQLPGFGAGFPGLAPPSGGGVASCLTPTSQLTAISTPNGDFEMGNATNWPGAIVIVGDPQGVGGSWYSSVNTLSPQWSYTGWGSTTFVAGQVYVARGWANSGSYLWFGDIAAGDYVGGNADPASGIFCVAWTPSADRTAVRLVQNLNPAGPTASASGTMEIDNLQAYTGSAGDTTEPIGDDNDSGTSPIGAPIDHGHAHGDVTTGSHPAEDVIYDNTASGLTATDAQAAIDELAVSASVPALDDLTDVAITAPAEHDALRYDGAGWVNDDRRWEPVTFNFGSGPELVWDGDDLVMEWKAY